MIRPTPGRAVWYRHRAGDGIIGHNDDPLAATIACVHTDTCVNLMVLGADGTPHARHNVTLCQGDEQPQPGQACWMPYQKGQAARTEQAERLAPAPQPAALNPAPSAAEIAAGNQGQDPANAEQTTQAQPPEPAPQG